METLKKWVNEKIEKCGLFTEDKDNFYRILELLDDIKTLKAEKQRQLEYKAFLIDKVIDYEKFIEVMRDLFTVNWTYGNRDIYLLIDNDDKTKEIKKEQYNILVKFLDYQE